MANFNLVVNTSNFKPFDIGASLLVLKDYRDAYYRMENKLEKLLDEYGNIVLPEDSKYRSTLDSYAEDFDDFATRFSKGMTRKSSSDWTNIRNRYNKEIKPIKLAVTAYNQYVDKWDKINTTDTSAIRGYDYTIDDFYGGKIPNLGYKSGELVEKDSLKYFTGVNNALVSDPNFKLILDKQLYLMTVNPGIDAASALRAALTEYSTSTDLQGNDNVNDLIAHMHKVFNSLGVDDFTDKAKSQVWNRIAMGLMDSILAPKQTTIKNENYISDLQRLANTRANEAHAADMTYKGFEKLGNNWVYTGVNASSHLATLPNGDIVIYNPVTKRWHNVTNPDNDMGGVGYTTSDITSLYNSQTALLAKVLTRDKKGYLPESTYGVLRRTFEPLTFRMEDVDGAASEQYIVDNLILKLSEGNTGYNTADWKPIAVSLSSMQWPNEVKQALLKKAQEQIPSLLMEDLDVWIDLDDFSNDHVRVVIKGSSEHGDYDGTTFDELIRSANTPAQPLGQTPLSPEAVDTLGLSKRPWEAVDE